MITWLLAISFGLSLSIISLLPEISGLFRHKKQWVPINIPPYQIGDDYHYYSTLNILYSLVFYKSNIIKNQISKVAVTQSFQFLPHLVVYIIGRKLFNSRIAILLVRFQARFFAFISVFLCTNYLSQHFNILVDEILILYCSVTTLFYFIFYPNVLTLSVRRSIGLHFYDKRHSFNNGQQMDLFRAAPESIFFLAPLIIILNFLNHSSEQAINKYVFVILLCISFLTVCNPILGLGVSIFAVLIFPSYSTFIFICISILISILLNKLFRSDQCGKEIFLGVPNLMHFEHKKLVLITSLIFISWFLEVTSFFPSKNVFIFTSISVLMSCWKDHILSRLYDRGLKPFLWLTVTLIVFNLVAKKSYQDFIWISFLVIFVLIYLIYIINQIIGSDKLGVYLLPKSSEHLLPLMMDSNKESFVTTVDPLSIILVGLYSKNPLVLYYFGLSKWGWRQNLLIFDFINKKLNNSPQFFPIFNKPDRKWLIDRLGTSRSKLDSITYDKKFIRYQLWMVLTYFSYNNEFSTFTELSRSNVNNKSVYKFIDLLEEAEIILPSYKLP